MGCSYAEGQIGLLTAFYDVLYGWFAVDFEQRLPWQPITICPTLDDDEFLHVNQLVAKTTTVQG